MKKFILTGIFLASAGFHYAQPVPAQPATPANTDALDEISDSSGRVTRGKVIRVTEKEVIYTDKASGEEKKLQTDNLIFIRSATGEYRFFFSQEPAAKPETKTGGSGEWEIAAGFGAHYADNSSAGEYTKNYATSLVTRYGQQIGSGFSSTGTDGTPGIHMQLFLEPRLNYENFSVGLSIGRAALPKTSAVVSAATQQVQTTVNVNGQFFPVALIFYYRWINDGPLGVNFGFGAGAIYSAVRISLLGGPAENEQILTSLNPMLVFKPEITYKAGPVRLHFSLPVYWAEARDVTDGEETLLQLNTKNIVATGLSGAGLMFSASIGL